MLKNYQTKNVLPTQQQFSVCIIYRLNSVLEKIILEFTSCYCSYCDGLKYTVNKYDRPCVCFLLGVRTIIINKRTFSSTAPRAYKFSGNKESYYIFFFLFLILTDHMVFRTDAWKSVTSTFPPRKHLRLIRTRQTVSLIPGGPIIII